MYINHYIISSKSTDFTPGNFEPVEFDGLLIHKHPKLNVTIANQKISKIALIGYIIDPLNPDASNDDIIQNLAGNCLTINDFFKKTEILSGRYVLLFKNDSSFIVKGDACHLRQIYYSYQDDKIVMTSSPKLFLEFFNFKLQTSNEKLNIINNSHFLKHESIWFGDESIDNRLNKLLPNHYIDIRKKDINRIPIILHNFSNEDQILNFAFMILNNTFSSLVNRYHLIQPLTAGLDSRILLAASKEVKNKIKYYVFNQSYSIIPDVWVPRNLSRRLKLNFNIIQPEELRTDFLREYKKEHIFPRILPKTAHIQYHFDCRYERKIINVNGNCAEIARCYYGHTKRKNNLDMLLTFAAYENSSKIPYFKSQLEKWYHNANHYAIDYGIPLLDLFYWEQKMGNWHAIWAHEQDIAVEEVSPFNNRSLLTALLEVSPARRKSPKYSFFKRLIGLLWEETLSEPINPGENYFRNIVHGNSILRYYGIKLKHAL